MASEQKIRTKTANSMGCRLRKIVDFMDNIQFLIIYSYFNL